MIKKCRSCGFSNLAEILDLGFAPPSNSLLTIEDLSRGEVHYPLVLLFCDNCKLVQTADFHTDKELFTNSYPYLSSTSATWLAHTYALVDSLVEEFSLNGNSLVAEIASNDGYLLDRLVEVGIPNYGIEPTSIAFQISIAKGHDVRNCFLTIETAAKIREEKGVADVVIANNVFAHVPNLNDFTQAVSLLISDSGVLIIEVQYFPELLKNNLFDTIYHEHYSYFSFTALSNLLSRFHLKVFRVQFLSTHGGSIRVYASRKQIELGEEPLIESLLDLERNATDVDFLIQFQERVNGTMRQLKRFFANNYLEGKVVAGVGAAAKAATLLNSLNLGIEDVSVIFDSALSKQGKFLPGSHIPIVAFEKIKQYPEIDAFVIFPWNISNELIEAIKQFRTGDFEAYRLLPDIQRLIV